MLTDSQIERYSRQIVLPEVGSRGQERLLAASAEIGGGGSAAIFCAAHLEAAGVGNLHVEAIGANGPLADALGLHVRNVDCVIGSTSFAQADVTILFGKVDPARAAAMGTLVWGGGVADGVIAASFPRGRGCISCLAALESRADASEAYAQLLGALLATMSLRALLGIGANDRAELLRLAPVASPLVFSPFPSHPECPVCS
jgi:hypothetical protein